MTRTDLIKALANKYNLQATATENIVSHILDNMARALSNGERIEIRGFGCFSLRYRKARPARNPKTGEKLMATGKYFVHFKPGKELKELVMDIT